MEGAEETRREKRKITFESKVYCCEETRRVLKSFLAAAT